jgi:transcriptional regulator GlxA family with amidase domain
MEPMHTVAILAMHGVVPADLAIPCDLFGRVRRPDPGEDYEVRVCGEAPEVRAGPFDIRAPWDLDDLARAETVIVPGIEDPTAPVPEPIVAALRAAAERGARIASVCSGAFVLAATGLLDGLRATTHWMIAGELAARYPAITVDPGVLYVDNGKILTSAGASAALDLCLHMVRRDHGHAAAAQAARLAVAPLEREGGQAQFIRRESPASSASIGPLLRWMDENSALPLTLAQLAARAGASSRTLSRRFRAQTGTTPLQWLLGARVRHARELLETTALSLEEIAAAAGFDGPATLRERFRREVGVSPSAYRRTFGRAAAPIPA